MGSYDRGRIWVGDLLPECEDQDLFAYFGKFGQVREATVQREKRTKLSRGFGFLKMGSQMLVDKVLKEPHKIWEHAITVKLASDVTIEPEPVPEGSEKADTEGRGEKRAAADDGEKEPGKFFISGLAAETTEEAVREHFEAFGDITEVSIVKDAQGKSKNYGFVIMADPSKDDEIAGEEHEVSGKMIEVKKCAKKTLKRAKGDGREAPAPSTARGGVGIAGPRDGFASRMGRGGKGDAGDPGKGDGKRGGAPSSRGGHGGWEDSKGSRGGWEDSKGSRGGSWEDSKGSRGGGREDSKGSRGGGWDAGKGKDKDYGSKGHDYGGKGRGGYGDDKGRGYGDDKGRSGYGDDRRGKDSKGGRDDGKGKGKDDGKGKHRNPYEGYGGPSGYGARSGGGDDRKGGKGKGGW